ncbi:GAF domain-containing protein [Nocardia wallacei]|uniref:GAF domain-containing protein n=1 Tax=Nocardia wallacei TaxID=480035 RepID=UPI00245814D8|nr:GAF domain-containing protein [Nocardia wallacei]
MSVGDWLLIETLAGPESWSVLTVGTAPRRWKSLARSVPARLLPIVAAARATGRTVERELPPSRQWWSRQAARAIPLAGPDGCVYGVQFGVGVATRRPSVAPFLMDARTRRTEVLSAGLGPAFDRGRSVWVGAESFEHIERFDGALDFVATVSRAEPGSRWMGTCTVRTPTGLRTLLIAARNGDDPHSWRGLLADVTESVPPQGKSFEAATVDTLVSTNPGLYLAVVDTARVRVIRWISEPLPGLRWTGETDERTLPHPDDRDRILAARNDILAGAPVSTIAGLRLAAHDGDWLTVDAEASPLPFGPPDAGPPQFALIRIELGGA